MGEGKKRALVVGVNEYEDKGFEKLKFAESDALAIYNEVLVNESIGGFETQDVVLLIPKPEKPEITKSEIEESLGNMLSESKEDDLVFIYFSGHGKLDKSNKLCLAVGKTRIKNLVATSIHIDSVKNMIHNSDCKRIVLIIDSCYSGAAGPITLKSEAEQPELAGSLKPISGEGRIVIAASQPLQKSGESEDIKHGIFTHYLLKGLKDGEADDGNDPDIYAHELFKYISDEVESATKGQQMPIMWGNGGIVIAKSSKNKKKGDIDSLFIEAKELLNNGKLRQALDIFNKVIKLDSDKTEALQQIQQIEDAFTTVDKLVKFYTSLLGKEPLTEEEKFFKKIYNSVLGLFDKPSSYLRVDEKIVAELVRNFVNGELSLKNLETTWKGMDNQGKDKAQTGADQPLKETPQKASDDSTKKVDTGPEKPPPPVISGGDKGASTKPQKADLEGQHLNVMRNQIFVSHILKDNNWLDMLKTGLKTYLDKEPNLKVWDKTQIKKGAKRKEEINNALAAAKFAVLLVSQEFLADDSIKQNELMPIFEAADKGELTILWIAVRKSSYDKTKLLDFEPVNDPSNPLASLGEADRDTELVNICDNIWKIVKT